MSINIDKLQAGSKPSPSVGQAQEERSLFDLLNRDIQLFGTQLGWAQKEGLYTEMAVLLRAGLDIKSTLELVQTNQDKKQIAAIYEQVYEALIGGAGLAEAMETTGKFSTYELASLRIAEESGKLLPVLEQLAAHFAKNVQLRRLLISALSYPILVLVVAGGTLLFLLNFLVPLFGDIYSRLDQDLPGITQLIISFSSILSTYLPLVVLAMVMMAGLLYYFRRRSVVRSWGAATLLRIPIFGPLIRQIYLSRFCHGLSFLLGSRIPLTQALELSGDMVAFYPISSVLPRVKTQIMQGESLHQSLAEASIFPHRMLALLKIGEQSNHLPEMLHKLAEQYDHQVEQKTKVLGSLLEPLLIVFLAITVGLVLVAMYLPIFKLVTNFGL